MVFNTTGIERNLQRYGLFAASERLLMELGRRGADRQQMHEVIREHSLTAWPLVQQGLENPLDQLLSTDPRILQYLSTDEVLALLDASEYLGDAPARAHLIASAIAQQQGHLE